MPMGDNNYPADSDQFFAFLGRTLKPLSDAANQYSDYKIHPNVPIYGGSNVGNLTGITGTQSLFNDMGKGLHPVYVKELKGLSQATGRPFNTLGFDPRLLDVVSLLGTTVGATQLLKGSAGLLGKTDYSGGLIPKASMSANDIGNAWATTPTGTSASSQVFDLAFQATDAKPPFSNLAKPTARPLDDLTAPIKSTGETNLSTISTPNVEKGIFQNYNTVPEIKKNLAKNQQELHDFLSRYNDTIGGNPANVNTRLKEDYKINMKLGEGKKQPQELTDVLGGRIVTNNIEDALQIIDDLPKRANVVKIDNWLTDPATPRGDGYRAAHFQIAFKNGTSAEVQIIPKPLLQINDKYKPFYDLEKHQKFTIKSPEEAAQFEKTYNQAQTERNAAWEKLKSKEYPQYQ